MVSTQSTTSCPEGDERKKPSHVQVDHVMERCGILKGAQSTFYDEKEIRRNARDSYVGKKEERNR